MPDRPIKARNVVSPYPRAILRVVKSWAGPCVVLGATTTTAIRVQSPSNVVVPLYDGMGRVSRGVAATTLRRAAGVPVDVFVVEVKTPSGVQGYGMLAVPQALEPRFLVEEG